MSKITDEFVCYGCSKKIEFDAKVSREGRIGNLIYVTTESHMNTFLKPILTDEEVFRKITSKDFKLQDYMPKFGKYEIEKFVLEELGKVIFSTNCLDDLFNTSVICEGTYIPARTIKEKLTSTILTEIPAEKITMYKLNIL